MNKSSLEREDNSHKGDYGKVGIIAGSRGMTGSAYLTAKSALRTGSGLVYSLVPERLESIMSIKLTEAIIKPVFDQGLGHFVKESLDDIVKNLKGLDVLALGPGLGIDEDRKFLVKELVTNIDLPMIIDADGLNCLAENMDILKNKEKDLIITPHPGEFSRLLNKDIKEIESKREYYAKLLAKEYGLTVVLKGHKTIVTNPEGQVYINTTGNPGMATAGSGDVLTGIITSLRGQGLDSFESGKLGVYLHGLAGDLAAGKKGQNGLIASDIMEAIPNALMDYENISIDLP